MNYTKYLHFWWFYYKFTEILTFCDVSACLLIIRRKQQPKCYWL